jgi:hypothetical protein
MSKNKHKANEGTSEYSKKRARTIERLLARSQEMPANVRNDLERELDGLKTTIADKSFQRLRSAMISKYHMVRFFGKSLLAWPLLQLLTWPCSERRKAMRRIKTLRRKIQESTDPAETKALEAELHVAHVDETYTQYYPHAEAYVSLYENSKAGSAAGKEADDEGDNAAASTKAKPPMWSVIEKTMEEGPTALRNLRERRPADKPEGHASGAATSTSSASKPNKKKQNSGQDKIHDQKLTDQRPVAAKSEAPQKAPTHGRPAATPAATQKDGKQPLNRRERRKLMHEALAAKKEEEEDQADGGGFFDF